MSPLTREDYDRILTEVRARRDRENAPGYVNKWKTHEPCEKCGKPLDEHNFREAVTCIYGGAPLKDGGTFDRSTADKVVDRICDRIADDFGLEGDGA